ncbi:MAG TPA: hypothetical protein VL001_07995 [Candidimonas sp.]|nr:hypothetical protein [Candidimonas sp.]
MNWIRPSNSTALSGALLLLALLSHTLRQDYTTTLLLLVSTFIAGAPIVLKALRSLKAKAFSIELLISISLAGALFIGEYVEAAALSFLFALGAYLEKAALRRIRNALGSRGEAFSETVDPATRTQMIERLEEAQESQAQAGGHQFLQRFARIYTPLILGLSVLVYLIADNVAQALTFLVIACPGALVISVPASLAAGLANAAGKGIFMRDAAALERLAAADTVLFHSPSIATESDSPMGLLQLRGHTVALVSDADTPGDERAAADVDIVMGTRPGLFIDDADIVIWSERPADVDRAKNLALATVANMKQNTYFSLGTAALLLAGVSVGSIQMASGMFLHEAGMLLVILNALRLLRHGQ